MWIFLGAISTHAMRLPIVVHARRAAAPSVTTLLISTVELVLDHVRQDMSQLALRRPVVFALVFSAPWVPISRPKLMA